MDGKARYQAPALNEGQEVFEVAAGSNGPIGNCQAAGS